MDIPFSYLLVIDVQQGFVTDETRSAIDRIADLLSRCRFTKVAGTVFANWEGSPWCHMGWRGCMSPEVQDMVPAIRRHIRDGDVYRKRYYSAVSDAVLEDIRNSEAKTVYVCGLDTDACVLATAFDLFCDGIDVRIIGDCCASSSGREAHEAGLTVIRHGIGTQNVITVSDILLQGGNVPAPR